jgi:hypothetical protein
MAHLRLSYASLSVAVWLFVIDSSSCKSDAIRLWADLAALI